VKKAPSGPLYSYSTYAKMLASFKAAVVLTTIAAASQVANAWYLPGSAPTDYKDGNGVAIKVNSLSSVNTQLPLRYYNLPFCAPDHIDESIENLGEILAGDLVQSSPYSVQMNVATSCSVLCTKKLTAEEKELLKSAIDDEYVVNLSADNLPAATKSLSEQGESYYAPGYPVGYVSNNKKHVLYNHVVITMKRHRATSSSDGEDVYRIVGFEVTPGSVSHVLVDGKYQCNQGGLAVIEDMKAEDMMTFSYAVRWEDSPILWATRWDETYLKEGDTEIHWFSIINSLMIVLFLSGMLAMILLRTLLRDIARYNELDNLEEAQEESGWKLVHGDVFRRPPYRKLLAVCAGTGVQMLGMTVVTILFAILGLLSPANRGALLQCMLLLFTFMGFPAGYVSARLNKLFEGDECTRSFRVTLMTALQFPGVCFGIFFILDILIWSKKSTGAVPFGTMFLLLVLWFGISLPLVFVGSYFGYKKPSVSLPVRTNQIPRQIPPQHWLTNPLFACLVGGVLPFGAVFTELLFIMSSIWQHRFYYLFGFLALVLVILVITCAEVSIAFTYFQLTGEDYRWWWRAYWCSASSSIYVFIYAVLYFCTRLHMTKFVSIALYFGYMFIASYAFCLLTGAVGFASTFIFVRAIYGSIKVD